MADYAGIDYGMGQTNIDPKTGIRYGVIRLDSLSEYAIEDFEPDYGEPHCPKCGNEAETIPSHTESDPSGEGKWVSVVQDMPQEMEEWEQDGTFAEYACLACKYLFDGEYAFGDAPVCHTLDKDGYKATLDEQGDVFLLASPYYTHAQFCSPCAPGAGHLDYPCPSGPKTYCFGHDWFDGKEAPYPVYSVETGMSVLPDIEASASDIDDIPDKPDEGDYIISDCGPLGSLSQVSIVNGRFLGQFPGFDSAMAAIRANMEKEAFWPNVWSESDHGNLSLVTDELTD